MERITTITQEQSLGVLKEFREVALQAELAELGAAGWVADPLHGGRPTAVCRALGQCDEWKILPTRQVQLVEKSGALTAREDVVVYPITKEYVAINRLMLRRESQKASVPPLWQRLEAGAEG